MSSLQQFFDLASAVQNPLERDAIVYWLKKD